MKVYTSQMSKIDRNNPNHLDITAKTGDPAFSPTWAMVMGVKNGNITQDQYKELYYALMRVSYQKNKERWEELLEREEVVLFCYCGAGAFCHRYLLAGILTKLGADYEGELK